jgi:ELWxxDGT repeat protein
MKIIKTLILQSFILTLFSCNVAEIAGLAETSLDPDTFNTGKNYFKVAAVCNGAGSASQMCIFDSKGVFIGKSAIGGSQAINANIQNIFTFKEHVYFSADDGSNGSELWRMSFRDGSYELVQDLNTGGGNGLPQYFTSDGENLYYIASDGGAVAQLCTYTGSGTPSCVGISSGGGTGSVDDLEYINGNLYICVTGSMKFIVPSTGNETAVGGGGYCTINMVHDNQYIFNANSTVLHKYDTTNNTEATDDLLVSISMYGAYNGYVFFDDNTDLYFYNNSNSTLTTLISSITSVGGFRRMRTDGNDAYLLFDDGAMEQILKTSFGSVNYDQVTSFSTTQNSFFQSNSIRDFYVIGSRLVVAVEAPISNTGLWVVDLFDDSSYRISPSSELIDPYDDIAVFY